jgi:hypothetical protein
LSALLGLAASRTARGLRGGGGRRDARSDPGVLVRSVIPRRGESGGS